MSPLATSTTVTDRDPKGLHFMQKCAAVYNKAGLDEDQAQQLNEDPEFAKELAMLIDKRSQPDNRFELINSFEITVPADYVHATRLTSFGKAHKKKFYYYNPELTDANFAKTPALVPGKKFLVKAFQIKGRVTSDDCLTQLKRVKATLIGAQGASLAYEQKKDELTVSQWSLSFDEKDNLPFVDGYHRVPSVYRVSGGGFGFDLDGFEYDWSDRYVLLAFCDLPAGEA
ncbi:MAG: hypothetical protein UT65_C0032G0017 [Parcubacteria group bacterium GW2011_GWF2_39_8b]|nr:MAG: hypothetical protein UT65_C0032G0017 [Parcubacteria group bacterium GW2011_GWF2_39_8b]KKR45930.1 MAG: hypothetical protein UT81_C0004G0028 [Parcubacteria group bacterium GW2011_GWA2_40_14]